MRIIMRIIKLSVPLQAGEVELDEPGLGKAVAFGVDGDTALIWIKQQPDAPQRERRVVIVQDGEYFNPNLRHVYTAIDANKVGWHLFQYGP